MAESSSGGEERRVSEEETVYSIRIPERVNREVEAALLQLARWQATDDDPVPEDSVRLAVAYREARATLARFPRRCPLIPEGVFRNEVRHLLFRRVPGAPVWRLLFTVEESDDGPVVRLLHLRMGTRRPIRHVEVDEIIGGT